MPETQARMVTVFERAGELVLSIETDAGRYTFPVTAVVLAGGISRAVDALAKAAVPAKGS